MKVLGVAFEPWETEVVAATNLGLIKQKFADESALFITDLYQVHFKNACRNLSRIIQGNPQPFYTFENEFYSFQRSNREDVDYSEKISKWSVENNLSISTRLLASSDLLFSPYERSPYYKPLTANDKLAIFYYFATKITYVLDSFRPDLVWTIERNYLAKYLFAILCESKNIVMKTLIITRLSNYWIFTTNFAGPLNVSSASQNLKNINSHSLRKSSCYKTSQSFEASDYLQNWRDNLHSSSMTLYKGGTEIKNKKLFHTHSLLVVHILSDLFVLTGRISHVCVTLLFHEKIYPIDYIYLSSSWRVCIYYCLQFARLLRYRIFRTSFSIRSLPESPYFYYPLNQRPEGSTATLARGLTDEIAIMIISTMLPYGTKLAVKENPNMIEDRRTSFYQNLSNLEDVMLIDPSVSSSSLLLNSIGVIALSGTALLEASLMGVPAHAIGTPEFISILSSSGIDNLEEFMLKSISGSHRDNKVKSENYVNFVFNKGIRINLGWQSLSDQSTLSNTANILSKYIISTCHDIYDF